MTPLGHLFAAICYLGAAGAGLASTRVARLELGVPWLLAGGVLLQAIGFFGFHVADPPVPLESLAAALSLIAWLTASAFLLSLGLARIRRVGTWVAFTAFGLTGVGLLGLELLGPPAPAGSAGGWPHAHVLLSSGGFGVLALTSLVGLAYLVKERALKSKREVRLPTLESLDRVGHVSLSVGFALLTLGLITGVIWSMQHEEGIFTGHALLSTAAWCVYLLPVTSRVLRGYRGQAPARGVVIGFVFLAISYLGVRLWGAA